MNKLFKKGHNMKVILQSGTVGNVKEVACPIREEVIVILHDENGQLIQDRGCISEILGEYTENSLIIAEDEFSTVKNDWQKEEIEIEFLNGSKIILNSDGIFYR